ncbi:Aste57867_21121 [Aphanomyces stellatus]|uniref:Aste57867_21121 protein n=1 Tax=Aphanomyces stellatus TaxID=120398 RepID=A0A485LGQ1_9STRA|nr:hypothetical protein As57867_021053 [Aphanomyces stellatus]VFT97795.1 Aste57867_21121 [Aphanomyces stellatus]
MTADNETTPLTKEFSTTGSDVERRVSSKVHSPWVYVPTLLAAFSIAYHLFSWGVTLAKPARPTHSPINCDLVIQTSGYIQLGNSSSKYFHWYLSPSATPPTIRLSSGSMNGPCNVQSDISLKSTGQHGLFRWASADPRIRRPERVRVLARLFGQTPELAQPIVLSHGRKFRWTLHSCDCAHHHHGKRKHNTTTRLNLQWIAIGNGLTNTEFQAAYQLDQVYKNAYNISLVPANAIAILNQSAASTYSINVKPTRPCANMPPIALTTFNTTAYHPYNPCDMRETCVGEARSATELTVTKFLNMPRVLSYLYMPPMFPLQRGEPGAHFVDNIATSAAPFVETVLHANLPVLLYAGDADLMCNWQGIDAWALNLTCDGAKAYANTTLTPLRRNGTEVAHIRSSSLLTFVRIKNAGHMVPRHQPATMLSLLTSFLTNQSFVF